MKKYFTSVGSAVYYAIVAIVIGLMFTAFVNVSDTVLTHIRENAGVVGVSLTSFIVGVIVLAIYFAYLDVQDNKALQQAKEGEFIRSLSSKPRQIMQADIEAYLNTPAGVDAVYRLIRNRTQKREQKKAQETNAIAAKASARKEESTSSITTHVKNDTTMSISGGGYFNEDQKATVESNKAVNLIAVKEPQVSEMLAKDNIRHIRGR